MNTIVLLVAIVCKGILCQEVLVPTDQMAAGLASNPVPLPYTETMCRTHGFTQALDYIVNEPKYGGWQITKIYCVNPKNYVPRHEA